MIRANSFQDGKLWINDTQYFDGISQEAWNLQIGSYVVARKWLNDRKTQRVVLQQHDIDHYVKIIAALHTTHVQLETLAAIGDSCLF